MEWIAEDICHQQLVNDTLLQIIIIEDVTKPSAVCTDNINLSISQEYAVLHYRDIDGGSYDACGIDQIEVSRDESNWDSVVIFSCEDIHQQVPVFLRVTDAKGNQAICWTEVIVEDKIAPVCNDLADITIGCDDYHNGELGVTTDSNNDKAFSESEWVNMTEVQMDFYNQEFGLPECFDNATCENLIIEQQYQLIEKTCGAFLAKRRFRARDWQGQGLVSNWAEQNITAQPTANWVITLPADWQGGCNDDIPVTEVVIENGACDLLAYEVEEKVFTSVEDACLKVIRTISIINWCQYQAGGETVTINRNENAQGMVTTPVIITSEGNENIGRLEYIQILKLQDDTAPIITLGEVDNCINEQACSEIKQFAISATDCNITATQNLEYNWTLSVNESEIASGVGNFFELPVEPKVEYSVKWFVSDNCGNTAWEEMTYEFWDCKKPSPYCLNGVSVELMPSTGMIQVWATDLERNSSDNCTPAERLDFRIWHAKLGEAPTDLEDVQVLPQQITFDCATLGTQSVNLYVIDEEGNFDFCTTFVTVQDNMGACENTADFNDMATVSGIIADWKQKAIEEVLVTADNANYVTQEDGHYGFDLARNQAYIIKPEKDTQPLNGVSTFDLVLISKHILGVTAFDNPYQMIAADVNGSGTITAFDMVQIRQLILNINTEFTNSPSWKFITANYEFTTNNPASENYPQVAEIIDLHTDMVIDFVAIKMGDVNGNASTNGLSVIESRSTEVFEIQTEDRVLKAGETYELAFTTEQLAQIAGYQFTMRFDKLKLEKLHSGIAKVDNFGLHKMDQGFITTSWNQSSVGSKHLAVGSNTATGQQGNKVILFTLQFTAQSNGKLSEQLSLANRPTRIEAYNENDELMEVQFTFTTPDFNDKFELYQNTPNPFQEETNIGFYLPDDGEVQLILRDEIGRVIQVQKGNYPKGHNSIQLDKQNLKNGFIIYQLSSKFGTKAKKMLKIK